MLDLERIQRLTPGTLSQQWYEDGAAVDPGTVTIGVTRADSTILVAAGTATTGTGTSPRTYNLTTTHTSLLDRLTVTWTSTLKGTLVSYLEVVGGFLFTIAQARTALGDAAYSASKIVEARTYAETELENALGYALVPRYARDTKSGAGGRVPLRLRPYLRTVRDVTVGGTALAAGDIAALSFDDTGFLYGYTWTAGYGNVVVGYEHGLDTPPSGASRAALALALDYLSDDTGSSIDPRAESIVTVDGTIRLRAGGQFNAAGVNEWVAANGIPALA